MVDGINKEHVGVSKNNGIPKSSILIGFSIIFTIHFVVFPYFWKHPCMMTTHNAQESKIIQK